MIQSAITVETSKPFHGYKSTKMVVRHDHEAFTDSLNVLLKEGWELHSYKSETVQHGTNGLNNMSKYSAFLVK